jgi:putative SOS response-associated peptidase YedK
MCGRFSQYFTWAEIHAFSSLLPAAPPSNLEPRWTISPTQQVGAIRATESGAWGYSDMRWGLVPSWWSKPLKDVPATFNARAETVADKPMFRSAFKQRRCLIPASGFFEWTGDKGSKQPWFISAKDGQPMTFAGLWEHWKDRETGEAMDSCTMIVLGANEFMGEVHDRMPAVIQPHDRQAWLDFPNAELLRPAPEDHLQMWKVTPAMNSSRYHEADAIVRIE